MAAALESGSSHPLAMAILAKAKELKVPVPPAFGAKALAGKGVSGNIGGVEVLLASPAAAAEIEDIESDLTARMDAFNDEGKTVFMMVANGQVAGVFAIGDEDRPDAVAGLKTLRDAGITPPVMLTGDNRRTAKAVGAGLGLEVKAELMPEDKQRIVQEMQSAGQIVAKVGDGINDAPALAAADIGIAMGGGTVVALETADVAVLHGRVTDIAAMIAPSKATMGNIKQNIVIALGLKAVFLVTTIVGITGLWPAILADTGATVLVTVNAKRLLGWQPEQSA
ncbi:P-type E1-E2 ATPase [Devosia subaequoris]|uniref:P-type Zn(2+) transporter n=1 Tax=Devosia subaequoris TaxID=395930 RepID=A0A7W6IPV1_9HYPH|nr:P-type E1-E2 ATPase [Devosia subaequoris]